MDKIIITEIETVFVCLECGRKIGHCKPDCSWYINPEDRQKCRELAGKYLRELYG